jgi:hypothetical protein
VRQILFAREEPYERPALFCYVIADRALQHRKTVLEGIEDGTQRSGPADFELHVILDLRKRSQMCREHDSYH